MTKARPLLNKVNKGDAILASDFNEITGRLNISSTIGGGGANVISNGAGFFVRDKPQKSPYRRWIARLSEDLGVGSGFFDPPATAECDSLILSNTENGSYLEKSLTENITVNNFDQMSLYFDNEIVSGYIAENGQYVVDWPGRRVLYAKSATISANSTGTVTICKYSSGTYPSTGVTISNVLNVTSTDATGVDVADFNIPFSVEVIPFDLSFTWALKPLICPTF